MHLLTLLLLVLALNTAAADGRAVDYTVDGKHYEGYFITPGPDAPLVLLVHDWDGLTDYEIRRAGMLADAGYAVFAADLFGAGIRPTRVTDRRQHTGELYRDRAQLRKLLNAALQEAHARAGPGIATVAAGYCFGGSAVLELARSGTELAGFVTFHGGLTTPEGQDYSNTRGPLLILHGTADSTISMDDFAALAEQLEDAGVAHEMITYSGAPHAFTVFDSDRYRPDADRKSWQRFLEFLQETTAYGPGNGN